MLEIDDPRKIKIVFGFLEDYQPSQAEKMSRLELFALFGIQSRAHLKDFEEFARGIATDPDYEKDHEEAYTSMIELSASEYARSPLRSANFVMEGAFFEAASLALYSFDQLALIFGMAAPNISANPEEFLNRCLEVSRDHSEALQLAKRILSGVKDYHKRYL